MKCVPHESHVLKRTAPSLPGGTSAIFTFPSQLCNHVVRWGKVTTILFDAHRGISSLNVFPHAFLSNKKITCLSWAHRFLFLLHLHPMFFILHGLRRSYWHVLLVRTMCSCVCIRHAVDCSWVGFSGFLLCDVTGIGETDTALRAETAEGTNRWRSRLQESRCWTRSPLVEMTGWVVSLYISILSRLTKKIIHNLCRCKALRGVSVHLADDEAWI